MSLIDETAIIETERLVLEPLRGEDADELVTVLADERLHEFIGGHPLTVEELRDRYDQLIAGSGTPAEVWFNWVARRRADSQAVGTMQATLTDDGGRRMADVAWVIGVPWQNQGYATEAAGALVDWLRQQGASSIVAYIHPLHHASAIVATRAGLRPTGDEVDGEQVWRLAEGT